MQRQSPKKREQQQLLTAATNNPKLRRILGTLHKLSQGVSRGHGRKRHTEEAAHHTDEESHIPDSTDVTNAEGLSLESHIH